MFIYTNIGIVSFWLGVINCFIESIKLHLFMLIVFTWISLGCQTNNAGYRWGVKLTMLDIAGVSN